jgi:1A family penicillin-binding protein
VRGRIVKGILWGAAAAAGLVVVALVWLAATLPLAGGTEPPGGPSLLIEDATGRVFASRGVFRGERVKLAELPPYVPAAAVAIEDRRFYSHFGIDLLGIGRALIANLRAGGVREGGSTITQQLAKLQFLSPERTLRRKLQEAMLAIWLELRLSKDEILARYLDSAYFGAGAWGIDGAARRYFLKSARDLTLPEAAMLAGLLKAPSAWSPARDPAAAKARAETVLEAMVETGAISEAEAASARAHPAAVALAPDTAAGWDWAADWVAGEVARITGPVTADFRVATTLDPELQEIAEKAVADVLAKEGRAKHASEAALVALAPDGAVLAMVGGRDYARSQFNRATQAKRQAGSLFKLFVYLAAFENGYTPESEMLDAPITIGGWSPENYNGVYRGRVSLREAFAESLNSVAVRLSEAVGHERVIRIARELGLTEPIPDVPSLALGTSQHTLLALTRAYAAVVAGTRAVEPYVVTAIKGPSAPLYRRVAPAAERPPWPARDAMMRLLRAVMREGTGRRADYGRPAVGKTGTTQDFRDAWFIGATADATVGVWVGNDDDSPMSGVTGGSLPATVWRRFMEEADRRKGGRGGDAGPVVDARVLRGVPRVVDTATLAFGARIVRLAGVEGERGEPARDMAAYLGGKEVVCTPSGAAHRCEVGGYDLAEVVVWNGGARAAPDAAPALKSAEAAARAARRGIWAGIARGG